MACDRDIYGNLNRCNSLGQLGRDLITPSFGLTRTPKYTLFSLSSHAHLTVTALRCPWPAVLIAFLPSREDPCALSSFRPCHLPGVPELPTTAPAFPRIAPLRRNGDSPRVPTIHLTEDCVIRVASFHLRLSPICLFRCAFCLYPMGGCFFIVCTMTRLSPSQYFDCNAASTK